jgi:hypothetical protein
LLARHGKQQHGIIVDRYGMTQLVETKPKQAMRPLGSLARIGFLKNSATPLQDTVNRRWGARAWGNNITVAEIAHYCKGAISYPTVDMQAGAHQSVGGSEALRFC